VYFSECVPEEAVRHRRRHRHAFALEREQFADEIPPRAILSVEQIKVEAH